MMNEKTLGQINEDAFIRTGIKHGDGQIVKGWECAAQAVIEAHEASKWQTIDKAPRDGTEFLAYDGGTFYAGAMADDKFCYTSKGSYLNLVKIYPTHFQHLTQPPK